MWLLAANIQVEYHVAFLQSAFSYRPANFSPRGRNLYLPTAAVMLLSGVTRSAFGVHPYRSQNTAPIRESRPAVLGRGGSLTQNAPNADRVTPDSNITAAIERYRLPRGEILDVAT